MDLERIKQSFRIRSGRARQQQKKKPRPAADLSSEYKSSGAANGDVSVPQLPEQHHNPSRKPAESIPRSNGDHAETELSLKEQEKVNGTSAPQGCINVPDEVERQEAHGSQGRHTPDISRRTTGLDLAPPSPGSETDDFDLNPPKPRPKPPSLEDLSELLFSPGHLNFLLHHPPQLARFSAFLQKYIPRHYPLLSQYLETQKAIKAIEYANAIAEGLKPQLTGKDCTLTLPYKAASIDPEFEHISNASFKALVGDALPTYISYSLIKIASECLINEITGRRTPVMRDVVGGLSEVFCLTDPQQRDNPIIYASEEFYHLTRYGPEDALNSNCRFLQGRRTSRDSSKRLKAAIERGEEICETILNYRRDGKPFINLLMIAPLHDRNGRLKYFLGAQLDVTSIVQGGRAFEGFQGYLDRRAKIQKSTYKRASDRIADPQQQCKNKALERLRDLSEMFDLEESAVVQANSRSNSLALDDEDNRSIGSVERTARRIYADSDASDIEDNNDTQEAADWELGPTGDGRLSGKLPGVYDSFMLLRPAPSLRIVFVSPRLHKIINVLQTPFMSHVAAPSAILAGLDESFRAGVPVSAKIHFNPERGENRLGTKLRNGTKHEDNQHGRAVWVSLTPLLGDDDRIGVWMCVVVEKSKIASAKRMQEAQTRAQADEPVTSIEDRANGGAQRSRRTGLQASIPRFQSHSKRSAGEQNRLSGDEDVSMEPVRMHTQTAVKKARGSPGAENGASETDEPSKAIRVMESIYFDAEDGQECARGQNDHDSNALQTAASDTTLPPPAEQQSQVPGATIAPTGEDKDPLANSQVYSIQSPEFPGLRAPPPAEDEFTTTTPSLQLPARHPSHRIVIEEDADVMNGESSDEYLGRPKSPHVPRSPSPVWSRSSDIPPSIPSSAQLPDDEDENNIEVDVDTPTRARFPPSRHESDKDDREEMKLEHDRDHNDDNLHPLRDTSPVNKQHHEAEKESSISINSPAHAQHHADATQSYHSSPSLSLAKEAPPVEPEVEVDEVPILDHDKDVEAWITEARPTLSHRQGSSMDYLRTGSSRWSRPPNLGKEAIDAANKNFMMDDDRITPADWCARSPYSVD